MSNLIVTAVLAGLFGLVIGVQVTRVTSARKRRRVAGGSPKADHRQRSLHASLRVAQRDAQKVRDELNAKTQTLELTAQELGAMRQRSNEREQEVTDLRKALAQECQKTNSLRENLTEHSVETLRAQSKVRELENEISVLRAGATVVESQVEKLTAEAEELGQRLRQLQDSDANAPGDEPYLTF